MKNVMRIFGDVLDEIDNSLNNAGAQDRGLGVVLLPIINTVLVVVGILAAVMIIMGGVQYTTSQGDAGKVKKAKDTIMYGIIGLIVAVSAFAIVNFVLDSLF